MRIKGDYVVFPYHTPNDTAARKAMLHGYGAAHYREAFEVELPDDLVSNPEAWFERYGKKTFGDMMLKMPGRIPTWTRYFYDPERYPSAKAEDHIDVSTYVGKRVIRLLGCRGVGIFFYLDEMA